MLNRRLSGLYIKLPLLVPVICLSLGQYCELIFKGFSLPAAAVFIAVLFSRIAALIVPFACIFTGSITYLASGGAVIRNDLNSAETYYTRVVETPRRRRPGEISLILEIQNFNSQAVVSSGGHLIQCRGKDLPWENESLLEEGDYVFIKARFRDVKFSYNPFSFNQRLLRRGISHECKLSFVSKAVSGGSSIKQVRNYIYTKISSVLGTGERAGLFLSMALGYKDSLSGETEAAFKRTGMAHLLVVSGYRISIIYFSSLIIFILILKYAGRVPYYLSLAQFASIFAFLTAFTYSLLVGLEGSVVRALTATFVFLICGLLERKKNFINSLIISLLVLQIAFPLSVFEPGVELTFAALLGISMAGEGKGIIPALLASTYASLSTAFVSYLWFGSFSFLGIILNPLFASLISIISCNFGFLAVLLLLSGIDSNGFVLNTIADCLVYFSDFIKYLSDAELLHII